MTSVYISAELQNAIRQQARNRCGFCLVSQNLLYGPLEFEHLVPRTGGGLTVESNLWLACRLCNGFKADQTAAIDPVTQQTVQIFDPRRQIWTEHFHWSDDGTEIVGLTPIGRATVTALQLNSSPPLGQRRLASSPGLTNHESFP